MRRIEYPAGLQKMRRRVSVCHPILVSASRKPEDRREEPGILLSRRIVNNCSHSPEQHHDHANAGQDAFAVERRDLKAGRVPSLPTTARHLPDLRSRCLEYRTDLLRFSAARRFRVLLRRSGRFRPGLDFWVAPSSIDGTARYRVNATREIPLVGRARIQCTESARDRRTSASESRGLWIFCPSH